MINVMNWRWQFSLVLFVSFSIVAAQADGVPGYENSGAQSLKLWVQAHSLIMNGTEVVKTNPATGAAIPGDTQTWNEVWVDVQGNRTLLRVFLGDQKPNAAASPDTALYQIQQKNTSINQARKMVTLAELTPKALDSVSIVYAGRIHQGADLAQIIQEASAAGMLQAQNGGWELNVGEPYFTPPAYKKPIRLALDAAFHPIQLEEPSRQFTFEWTQKEPEGFWYVHHTIMESKNEKSPLKLQFEQWVREIEINPALPANLFDISYPKEYQVHDLSQQLKSPLK